MTEQYRICIGQPPLLSLYRRMYKIYFHLVRIQNKLLKVEMNGGCCTFIILKVRDGICNFSYCPSFIDALSDIYDCAIIHNYTAERRAENDPVSSFIRYKISE